MYHLILVDGPNERYGIYTNGGFLSESTSEKIAMSKLSIFDNVECLMQDQKLSLIK